MRIIFAWCMFFVFLAGLIICILLGNTKYLSSDQATGIGLICATVSSFSGIIAFMETYLFPHD